MHPKSRQRFTLKIIASYSILGTLALLAAFFLYSEFENYSSSHNLEQDNLKLLKTSALLTELYEAENLSKLALQTKRRSKLRAYAKKVDSIFLTIKDLQLATKNKAQQLRLDSIKRLLQQKVHNNSELRKLKLENTKNALVDSLLKKFDKINLDIGLITPESFAPNFKELPPKAQKSIREFVDLLNDNIPEGEGENTANIDSLLRISKSILENAKREQSRTERSVLGKELEIYKADLEFSQKLRSMITAFEKEIIANFYLNNLQKQQTIKRSLQLTGVAIFLGLIVVWLSTLFITKDFWKVQRYRQQLEQEKNYSESLLKSREQLISTVSHDLRTPLNSINGYTELLTHENLNAKKKDYLKNIKSSVTYVEKLVNDLLDFSKLESGKIKPEQIPFELSHIISETVEGFEEIRRKKAIEIRLDISKELAAPIIGDPFRLRQILTNLLGNSYKFTHSGYVEVKACTKEINGEPQIEILVSDTGIGIAKEKQELIFKEFTQAGRSIEKEYGGYGLGLTIAKKLTQLLGGTLHLKSTEHVGTTFALTLPLRFSDDEIPGKKPNTLLFKKPPSLLIFDDDETLLKLLTETCRLHGLTTQVFSSFEQLSKTDNLKYDLVLTDIQMPKVNGFNVIKELKNQDYTHYQGQPIIAMTGKRDIDQNVFKDAGFAHVLRKPFSQMDLLKAIAKVLDLENTDIAKAEAIENTTSPLFCLDAISAFVGKSEGLENILQSFLENTDQNMMALYNALKASDYDEIRSICHRMLPMFRQLEVQQAIPLLEKLEHFSNTTKDLQITKVFEQLRTTVLDLQKGLRNYLATLPVDTD